MHSQQIVSRSEPIRRPHCAARGSPEIVVDAWASWDPDSACWTLQTTFDHAECRDCGSAPELAWIAESGADQEEETA